MILNLYRIAKQRPDLVKYRDAAGYLELALGTARAWSLGSDFRGCGSASYSRGVDFCSALYLE